MRVIGLMSGTSLDGIDAAVVRIDGAADAPEWELEGFITVPYSLEQRAGIQAAIGGGGPAELSRLHAGLGEWFGKAAVAACESVGCSVDDVDLIGSHGQTVWHQPPTDARRGSSLQLGCPSTIAERTGVPVISDFRARDMAAGGQGAPLVPWVDRLLFRTGSRRVLLNIGGMANVTWLAPEGDTAPPIAFDTGPGVALVDAAVELGTDGARAYDQDGDWASVGSVDDALLRELLDHPYLRRPPPKSTGRETFGRPLVEELAGRVAADQEGREDRPRVADAGSWRDLSATLTEFTARSIAGAIEQWLVPHGVDEVVATGGGSRNPVLLEWLERSLAPIPLRPSTVLGIDPEAKEALSFAVLAWAHARGIPGNVPEATGAHGPRVLGSRTPGGLRSGESTLATD